jgi:FKBP-type peptidyl-prolyl cis-trans isomerase 2
MQTIHPGDLVELRYEMHLPDGSPSPPGAAGRRPLVMTVGRGNPCLPGLGTSLVGLTAGARLSVHVPAGQAFGPSDPSRVRRRSRSRFPPDMLLYIGKRLHFRDDFGIYRLARVADVTDRYVVCDENHPWAGQAVIEEIDILTIYAPGGTAEDDPGQAVKAEDQAGRPPSPGRVVVFDPDAPSLAAVYEALVGWRVDVVYGATADTLPCDWEPGDARLLIVGVGGELADTLDLCRFLAFCAAPPQPSSNAAAQAAAEHSRGAVRRDGIPLVVLMPHQAGTMVSAALEAGADGCLMLPLRAEDVRAVVDQGRAGTRQGRHMLNLDRTEREDRWADEGGQGEQARPRG